MVDPTDHVHEHDERPDTAMHPLTKRTTPTAILNTDRVPIRYRPRFTMSEAVILNLLVNASPRHVTTDEILRQMRRYSRHGMGLMESSLKQAMVSLRAKLGEKAWDPQQIVSVKKLYKKPDHERAHWHTIGYQWVDPEQRG